MFWDKGAEIGLRAVACLHTPTFSFRILSVYQFR